MELKESTTIAFTGDIGFDKYMDKKWEDDALLAPGILEFLTSAVSDIPLRALHSMPGLQFLKRRPGRSA